jgi:hypothetical protein
LVGKYGGGFHILIGNGTGTFQPPASINLSTFANGVFGNPGVGDFNGDMRDDIVQAGQGGTVEVLLGNTTGNPPLRPAVLRTLHTQITVNGTAVADMNGDGLPDIISVGNRISVMLQEAPE